MVCLLQQTYDACPNNEGRLDRLHTVKLHSRDGVTHDTSSCRLSSRHRTYDTDSHRQVVVAQLLVGDHKCRDSCGQLNHLPQRGSESDRRHIQALSPLAIVITVIMCAVAAVIAAIMCAIAAIIAAIMCAITAIIAANMCAVTAIVAAVIAAIMCTVAPPARGQMRFCQPPLCNAGGGAIIRHGARGGPPSCSASWQARRCWRGIGG